MGLFSFFRRKQDRTKARENEVNPDSLILGDPFSNEENGHYKNKGTQPGLDQIFTYTLANFEEKGFNDALAIPDSSFKEENIDLLKKELLVRMDHATIFYQQQLRETEYKIGASKRTELSEIVEKLETRHLIIENNIKQVESLKKECEQDKGLIERIKASYSKGFKRGLTSLFTNDFREIKKTISYENLVD